MPMCVTSRALEPNQRWATTQSCSALSSRKERSPAAAALPASVILTALHELEPVEAARRQREQVRQLADGREARATEHLDRVATPPRGQVELDRLGRSREVVH